MEADQQLRTIADAATQEPGAAAWPDQLLTSVLLECDECDEYYEEDPAEWQYCPRCATELREVDQSL